MGAGVKPKKVDGLGFRESFIQKSHDQASTLGQVWSLPSESEVLTQLTLIFSPGHEKSREDIRYILVKNPKSPPVWPGSCHSSPHACAVPLQTANIPPSPPLIALTCLGPRFSNWRFSNTAVSSFLSFMISPSIAFKGSVGVDQSYERVCPSVFYHFYIIFQKTFEIKGFIYQT